LRASGVSLCVSGRVLKASGMGVKQSGVLYGRPAHGRPFRRADNECLTKKSLKQRLLIETDN
jgi:hypothetical protein